MCVKKKTKKQQKKPLFVDFCAYVIYQFIWVPTGYTTKKKTGKKSKNTQKTTKKTPKFPCIKDMKINRGKRKSTQ